MCNRVIRKHLGSVTLNRSKNERVRYTVILDQGTPGLFSIIDNASHSVLLTSTDTPGPQGPKWVREWPQPGDAVTHDTLQTYLLQFVGAKKYTVLIEHIDAAGAVLDTPLDV